MLKNRNGRPKILVTAAASGSAVAIIRSLGSRGWHVFAGDSRTNSPGFYSRYTQERLLHPPPETAPREFIAALLETAENSEIDLIIPVFDAVVLPLSDSRSCFEEICQLALPDTDSLDVAMNKFKTLKLAERLEVPVPRTCLVQTTQQALDLKQSLGWPVVLKPQASRVYCEGTIENLTVCYAENSEQLAERMRHFEGRCPVLLQEYCSGVGIGVELLAHRGRPLAAFQHRRLREIPINGGVSTFRESVRLDPVLYGYATRLLEDLNWTGLAMVEFKVGENGPKLMEINGRVWGSLPLAIRCGIDFPARLADLYLYGPPSTEVTSATNYKIGLRMRNLELDVSWIGQVLCGNRQYVSLAMPSRLKAVAALLGLLNPSYKCDMLSLNDPRPGWMEISKLIGKLGKNLRQAILFDIATHVGMQPK